MASYDYDYDYDSVVRAVINHGSNQWDVIGGQLGMTPARIGTLTSGKPTDAGKLLALIGDRKSAWGTDNVVKQLLGACGKLPGSPILEAVLEELKTSGKKHPSEAATAPRPDQESSAKVDGVVESRELSKAAKKVAANWSEVAALLDPDYFSPDQIKVIKQQDSQVFDQARAMLFNWKSRLGNKATRRSLIEAMVDAGYTAQANDVFGEAIVRSASSS